jgi:diguanylate cyclase (GGDEF)-like protein
MEKTRLRPSAAPREDAMKDPNDTRDVGPRIGSPLWIYLSAVTVTGLGVLASAAPSLSVDALHELAGHPLFWVIAALALGGEFRPIVTPGRSDPDSGVTSLTFCFAALLYWGFATAAILRCATMLITALSGRQAPFRAAFNAAQFTLSLGVSAAVLAAVGLHPMPLAPWVLTGPEIGAVGLAALAHFACNFVLVGVAVALHERAPVLATLRRALPYQAFVSLVLLSAAPLVVVVMSRSVVLVLLFLLPLAAVYANAAMSLRREYQALHDELTGLPNRTLLIRKTTDALGGVARSGGMAGFLLLDLDRFKEVNDTLGHPVGDKLLRVVAYRLTHSVRPGDMVARLGGDEFAVLLPSVKTVGAAREVASRLRAALAEPIRLEGISFEIEASVGIALYPRDAATVDGLMQRADVAMYLAKERHSGVEAYVVRSDRDSPARLSLLGDLRRGIDHGEFELHYQPKVFLADGRTAGMEALVRWRHPRRGLLTPGAFVPLVAQSFLMRDLTAHVVQAALQQARLWRQGGLAVQLSINVSVRDLLDGGLAGTIERGLASCGLPPETLLLEVSERALTNDAAGATAVVAGLASIGVSLSLDDFATGRASLGRLRCLPVSEIKIDSSFTDRLPRSADDGLIVRALVDLARALGIRSVAKRIESAEAAAALHAIGCDAAQGWHFSRPLNAASATAWLAGDLAHEAARVPRPPATAPDGGERRRAATAPDGGERRRAATAPDGGERRLVNGSPPGGQRRLAPAAPGGGEQSASVAPPAGLLDGR